MLKNPKAVNEADVEAEAPEALRRALSDVPVLADFQLDTTVRSGPDRGIDFVVNLRVHRQLWKLVCEVKANGQPRIIRDAASQVRAYAHKLGPRAIPVIVTPYLSEEARGLCREMEVNYLDLAGNCRFSFDGVFIERESASRPPVAKRELRSLFKPKSAQVLRLLLRRPNRTWKVAELAQTAGVSLGHISNVTSALIDREWGTRDEAGFKLAKPDALLDNWRDNYEAPSGEVKRYYTVLHGKAFEKAAEHFFEEVSDAAALASFSAAEWLAPYGRVANHYVYATRPALPILRSVFRAEPATRGDNLLVTVLEEDGVLHDALEPHHGIRTTSLVQTYLDLAQAGERGREAADHLREERLTWLS